MTVLGKEDWRSVIGLVTNAKQVVSSVQDVARKPADYAKLRGQTNVSGKASRFPAVTVLGFISRSQTSQ